MSYDLMVFDSTQVPADRSAFMTWYREVVSWKEDRDFNSPEGMTGNLRKFFDALRQEFPPMNGPFAADLIEGAPPKIGFIGRLMGKKPPAPIDESLITEYTLGRNCIYMCFAWSAADKAYNRVLNAALTHDVGFFDVSDTNGVILRTQGEIEDFMGL